MSGLLALFAILWPYLAILATLVLSGAGAPIPEEVTVIAAGILSSHGELEPLAALLVCWCGALAGDCMLYYLGHHFGKNVVREHHLWTYFVTPQREAQMEEAISKHGLKVLFTARFLVGVRSAVYLAAGILRVPFRRFLLTDMVSATLVVGLFFAISYYFGTAITAWIRDAQFLLTIVILLAVAGLGLYLWRRHRRKTSGCGSHRAEDEQTARKP